MNKQRISKNLLIYDQGRKVLLAAVIVYVITAIAFFFVAPSSGIIASGLATALVFCYRNVQQGKTGGLNWGGILTGMNGVAALWFLWLVRGAARWSLVVIIGGIVLVAAFFVAMMLRGMKAHMNIPEKVDIAQTLTEYKGIKKQQKMENSFNGKAFRESVKDGTFEMPLVLKSETPL